MEIKGSKFLLRQWRDDDVESMIKQANNPNVSRYTSARFPYPFTKDNAVFWMKFGSERKALNLAIEVASLAVGGIFLVLDEEEHQKSAEIGYWLGEEYWGKGITTEAIKLTTEFGFKNFDINRIYGTVLEKNVASQKVLLKVGYKLESVKKNKLTKNDVIMDIHVYEITR